VFLLITLAFPSVGGARAWIRIPFPGTELTLQPSEFAKIVAILMFAVYLGDLPKNIARKSSEIMGPPIFTLVGMFMIMVVLQRDLGTAVVLFVICFFVFLLPSHRKLRDWQRPALFMSAFVSAVLLFLMSDPGIKLLKSIDKGGYQLQRFLAAYNPFAIAQEGGYQIVSSLIAITKGNWIGVGLGRSLQKYGYLPAARTDFILAIITEETGMIGFTIILGFYGLIIYHLFKGIFRTTDEKSRMTLVGIALYLLVHFILNIGGVTALIPLTGVPLLFISQGGSSTMAIMCGLGIAQNILAKQNAKRAL
jgi:cell division protein FtsW